MARIAENAVIQDGVWYNPGEEIPDLGNWVRVHHDGAKRYYEGVSTEILEAEFRSCPVSREQIERAFEVAISEVKSSELSYGNLSTLLCQVFRNRSSQPCLSDAAQEQIRAILNVK